jgi:hypothetical protein
MVDCGNHMRVIKGHGENGKWHDIKFEALQYLTMLANNGWYNMP